MKKLLSISTSLTAIFLGSFLLAQAATVFYSNQVGSTPQNGYYLKTDGTNSTWAAVSASGGSGTVGTSTNETQGYLPYWTTTSGTPALLGKVSTTSVTCSGNTSCTGFTVIGSSPITISSTGGGTGFSTTSPVAGSNVLVYSASGTGSAYGAATTSLTASGVLSLSNPISVLGGSASALTLTGGSAGQVLGWLSGIPTWTASSSVAAGSGISIAVNGAVTTVTNTGVTSNGGDWAGTWQTFSPAHFQTAGSYLTSVTASAPIFSSGGLTPNITWAGLATTSQPSSSNILTSNGGAGVYGTATSTLSATTPLTGSFTQVGSGGSLGCTTAASGVAGCLSNTAFDTFNGKQNALTAAWPQILTGATLTFGGLSTSSPIVSGQPLYATGVNTMASVASSTFLTSIGGISSVFADAPLGGNGASGSHLTCTGCLTANQSITLSGVVTGSGATAITTAFGSQTAGVLGNAATGNTAPMSTTTLYGALGTAGFVLTSQGGKAVWAATSTNALTVTTNAALTGVVTSTGSTNITSFGSQTAGILGAVAIANTSVLATSTIFGNTATFLTTGNVGIASTTPTYLFSVGTTGTDAYITSTGQIVGWDTTNNWKGRISPTRSFVLSTATTTAGVASTTGSAYSPYLVMPFAGTLRQVRCTTDASFLGVNTQIAGSNTAPSYFVASTTVGKVPFTGSNTFTAGQKILMNVGTTTSWGGSSISCTFDVTETP